VNSNTYPKKILQPYQSNRGLSSSFLPRAGHGKGYYSSEKQGENDQLYQEGNWRI